MFAGGSNAGSQHASSLSDLELRNLAVDTGRERPGDGKGPAQTDSWSYTAGISDSRSIQYNVNARPDRVGGNCLFADVLLCFVCPTWTWLWYPTAGGVLSIRTLAGSFAPKTQPGSLGKALHATSTIARGSRRDESAAVSKATAAASPGAIGRVPIFLSDFRAFHASDVIWSDSPSQRLGRRRPAFLVPRLRSAPTLRCE